MKITLTDTALKQFTEMFEREKPDPSVVVRLGLRGGGCSGYTIVLEFDVQKENDTVFDYGIFKIVCDEMSIMYLEDTEIDYKSDLMSGGFLFNVPNSKSTCGCGSSISL